MEEIQPVFFGKLSRKFEENQNFSHFSAYSVYQVFVASNETVKNKRKTCICSSLKRDTHGRKSTRLFDIKLIRTFCKKIYFLHFRYVRPVKAAIRRTKPEKKVLKHRSQKDIR